MTAGEFVTLQRLLDSISQQSVLPIIRFDDSFYLEGLTSFILALHDYTWIGLMSVLGFILIWFADVKYTRVSVECFEECAQFCGLSLFPVTWFSWSLVGGLWISPNRIWDICPFCLIKQWTMIVIMGTTLDKPWTHTLRCHFSYCGTATKRRSETLASNFD